MKSGATISWAQIVYLTYHPNVDQSIFSLRLFLHQVSFKTKVPTFIIPSTFLSHLLPFNFYSHLFIQYDTV